MDVRISLETSGKACAEDHPRIKALEAKGFQLKAIDYPEGSGSPRVNATLERRAPDDPAPTDP